MKTIRKEKIQLIECTVIPNLDDMEYGKMYYIANRDIAFHLCLCGCGQFSGINVCEHGWKITNKYPLSIEGSILLGQGCRSHYIITDGIANFV